MRLPPIPTPILRFIHVDNLEACVRRGGLYAPNYTPNDGLGYRTIHNVDIQAKRRIVHIPCGAGGTIHDYVSFYFGYLSPMMLQLKTGRVPGYAEGQDPLVYLVTTAQAVHAAGAKYAFSDGHGLAAFTRWFDDLADLDKVDWNMVNQRYWADNVDDMDRQRRKQAEFLIHESCDWSLIDEIAVINNAMKARVEAVLEAVSPSHRPRVAIRRDWYYH